MAYLLLPFEKLRLDPGNFARSSEGITELSNSIHRHGLLQNLVVDKVVGEDAYVVRAGERRYRAIAKLIEQGKWDSPVPCLESTDEVVQVVENIHREDITPWALGHRYSEILERGATMTQIAAAVGKSYGHVSFHVNIARCLHPDAIALMEQYGPKLFTKKHLGDLCRYIEPVTLEPQSAPQVHYIEKSMESSVKEKGVRKAGDRRMSRGSQVVYRLDRLKSGEVKVPTQLQPYINPLVNYLDGVTADIRLPGAKQ